MPYLEQNLRRYLESQPQGLPQTVRQTSVPDLARLKAIDEKLRKKENSLLEREAYLREKELFLN